MLRHLEALATELVRAGWTVLAVINPDRRLGDIAARMAAAGVQVERAAAGSWREVGRLASWLRLLRRLRPDAVHFHQCSADENAPAILLAAACRVPVVLTEHLPFWRRSSSRLRRRLKRLLLRIVRRVVLLGPSLVVPYVEATGVRRERVLALPPFSFPVPARERRWQSVVGFIGELSERKGAHRLAEMAPRMLAAGYRLRVFGRGELAGRLQELAEATAGAVTLSSYRSDPRRALEEIDALLLLSSTEGLPLVILEAVSAGVPVLTTRVGVIADYFDEGQGLLYLDGTGADDVLPKLAELGDEERRRGIVARGRERLQSGLKAADLARRLADIYLRGRGR